MRILMVSPGYPGQMPAFAAALAEQGATVFGLGDQSFDALPTNVQRAVSAHLSVPDLWDEEAVVRRVRDEARKVRIDRVECLWEPAMMLAARIRTALGLPGLTPSQTVGFRDKEVMKRRLDAAGIRTPRHWHATTRDGVRQGAEHVGYPLIVKPVSGAGATSTYRVDDPDGLEQVLPALTRVEAVSVEEFIEGEELTHDTICADGRVLYENVAWYRTKPIEEKKHAWVSPSCICLRDLDAPEIVEGRRLGYRVLDTLGFSTGFTHMEWFRKPDGEVVFGEIAARPAGAHLVDAMNYAADIDLFRGWAEAVCRGQFSQRVDRRYHAAVVGKRAVGHGRIREIQGLERLVQENHPWVAGYRMPGFGQPAGDWRAGSPSDGVIFVRHPEFEACRQLADRAATDVKILAG